MERSDMDRRYSRRARRGPPGGGINAWVRLRGEWVPRIVLSGMEATAEGLCLRRITQGLIVAAIRIAGCGDDAEPPSI